MKPKLPIGQTVTADDAPALPLWIDGHAYLMMATDFLPVCDATGKPVRRVPLYGEEAVRAAVESAPAGRARWLVMSAASRAACFDALAGLLARFREHLQGLLAEEAGLSGAAGEAELTAALAGLPGADLLTESGPALVAVISAAEAPLAAPLSCVVAALRAGSAVLLKPSAKAPSALFALAELCSRAGFPPGLVNCIHGEEKVLAALGREPAIERVAVVAAAARAARIAALVDPADAGKAVAGPSGPALLARWQATLAPR